MVASPDTLSTTVQIEGDALGAIAAPLHRLHARASEVGVEDFAPAVMLVSRLLAVKPLSPNT